MKLLMSSLFHRANRPTRAHLLYHSRRVLTFKFSVWFIFVFAVSSAWAADASKDVRFVIDTSRSVSASDPLRIRKLLPDTAAQAMLNNGDFIGVWEFGATANESVAYGPLSNRKREALFSSNDYLNADARIRNLRSALEAVAFSNTTVKEKGGQTEVFIVTDGGIFLRSPIKDALLEDYIIKSVIPLLKSKDIRVNVIEFSNQGELFYRRIAKETGGQYLSLKNDRFPAVSALKFVGERLGASVDLATNASFAVTDSNSDIHLVMPGVGRRPVRIDHPDGWLLKEDDASQYVAFNKSGTSMLVTISQKEIDRLGFDVSYWAVRGARAPGVIIIGSPSSYLAGVVPTAEQLAAQHAFAKSRPPFEPEPEPEVAEPTVDEAFEIEEAEVSLLSLVQGEVGLEGRLFFKEGVNGQPRENVSVRFQPEIDYLTESGDDLFEVTLFARFDQNDGNRSHFDVREALWTHVGDGWELKSGIGKVFWGVTESRHLVDIVNQTDQLEQPEQEDKLGQPMIKLGLEYDWGNLDLFVLPYFRERAFPGKDGRMGTPLPVDTGNAIYDSGAEELRTSVAARLFGYLDDLEYAISVFSGTAREPGLAFNGNVTNPQLLPVYQTIDQAGLELLYIVDDWLLKFEGISRSGQGDRFAAAVAGFEYTQVGIFGSDGDLGWVAEYLWDERGDQADSFFEHDIFLGWRWTANDVDSTTALLGIIRDHQTEETLYSLEAERRLTSSLKLDVNLRLFSGAKSYPASTQLLLTELSNPNVDNKLGVLNREDHVQFELTWFF